MRLQSQDKSQVENLLRPTHRWRITPPQKKKEKKKETVEACVDGFIFILEKIPPATSRLQLQAETGSNVSGQCFSPLPGCI